MVALPAVRNHPQTAPVCDCAIGRSHRGACVLVAGCASKSTAWRPCWAGTPALAQLAQSPAARPSTISSSPSIWPMPWGRCCEAGERMDRVADGALGCAGVRLQIPPAVQAAVQAHFDGEPEALRPRSRRRRCSCSERRAQPGAQSKRPALARCVAGSPGTSRECKRIRRPWRWYKSALGRPVQARV